MAALTSNGFGAVVQADTARGNAASATMTFTLLGLAELGHIRGATWGEEGLFVVAGHGKVASCPNEMRMNTSEWHCDALDVPAMPLAGSASGVVIDPGQGSPLRGAMSIGGDAVGLMELQLINGHLSWHVNTVVTAVFDHPQDEEQIDAVVAISLSTSRLSVSTRDGAVHQWQLHGGFPVSGDVRELPAVTSVLQSRERTWHGACALPDGKSVRLASRWQKVKDGGLVWKNELLL